jgi:hypothetical protein
MGYGERERERERERGRKYSRRIDKVKNNGKMRYILLWEGRRKSTILLEDSQASPSRPSDRAV